ncbi:hydrogenase maturation nickel metallochaperone HypA [Frankia casuarinae]|uniref:hydrogenase maturation nickel metallochaperone HypA n=1 Tax=Frankia casuarinae (strain DSM 45818 / CECT 9043 / HFP020203 / CcI3) TaxID=106370 RepID=UPI002418B822|nr:hydrogenase maturation nickel metallochaperone HypA [Frankia casuarinae]
MLAGSVLAGSVLEVESVPVSVCCRVCGTRGELADRALRCGTCGAAGVTIVTGEEFLVTSFEVASDPVVPDPAAPGSAAPDTVEA